MTIRNSTRMMMITKSFWMIKNKENSIKKSNQIMKNKMLINFRRNNLFKKDKNKRYPKTLSKMMKQFPSKTQS